MEAGLTLVSALRRRGELVLALTRLQELAELLPTIDPSQQILYQEEQGAVLMARGEYRQAIEELQKALALAETTAGEPTARGRLLLAEALRVVGNLPESHKLITEAIDAYKDREATMGLSDAYAQLGLWHEDNESYAPALHAFQESLKQDELSDDRVGQAQAKRHMARVLRKSGDAPRARELLIEARDVLFREDHVELAHLWQEEAELALSGDAPKYEDAIHLFTRALDVTIEDGDERAIAIAKRHLARAYREDDDLKRAEELLQAAIPALEQRGDLRELDELLDDLGEVFLEQDRYADAQKVLKESLALDEQLGRVGSKARSLLLLGQVAHESGDHESAFRYLEQAVKVYEDAQQEVGLSEALQHMAAWHLDRGQATHAIDLLRRGLEIDSRLDDALGRARARRLFAAAYRQHGDLERADEYLDEARRDLAPIDDPVERALLDCENAKIDLARGAADAAGKLALRAQSIFEGVGQRPVDVGACERLRAMSAAHCGRYEEALELLNQARTVFEERGDIPELDELHDDLAEVWLMQGRLDLARASAKDSLAVGAAPGGCAFGRGRSLLLLAQISMDEGNEGQTSSREYIDEALRLYESQHNEAGECRAYLASGDWHMAEDSLDDAAAEYKKARALAHRLRDLHRAATCHRKLASIHLQRHEIQRAEDALRDAKESLTDIADPRACAPLDLEWGRLMLAKTEHTEAIKSLRKAVTAFRKLHIDEEWRIALRLLSTCLQADGQTRAALECLREMEQESRSMYNVLLSDLHPRIAEASRPSFASGHFKDAVNNAFNEVELLIKEHTARLPNPPEWKDNFSKHVRLLTTQDAPWGRGITGKNDGLDTFQHYIKGSSEFFYNPSKHENVNFSAVTAFTAIATAHVIAETIEMRELPWLLHCEDESASAATVDYQLHS